jgi:DivIVA domain-containing protein
LQEEIARIRSASFESAVDATPSFALSRRGYDRDEVDKFLSELADRLEALDAERPEPAEHSPSDAMRREMELMGQKTAEILAQAEESAERLRSEATQEASKALARAREEVAEAKQAAEQARAGATAESERITREADAYSKRVRAEADADAQAVRAQAASELAETVERAKADAVASVQAEDEERRKLNDELEELAARRDAAREELRKIAGVLADAAGADQPAGSGSEPADPAPDGADSTAANPPLRAV